MYSFVLHFLVEYIVIKISNTLFNQEGHFKGFKLNFCWSGCGGWPNILSSVTRSRVLPTKCWITRGRVVPKILTIISLVMILISTKEEYQHDRECSP